MPRVARAVEATTVYAARRLFDGVAMRPGATVVTRGDRIVSLRRNDAGHDAMVVDLGDATLMPGLIDCHTHVCPMIVVSSYALEAYRPGLASDSPASAAIMAVRNARTMLSNGFTTLRDCGGGRRGRSGAARCDR